MFMEMKSTCLLRPRDLEEFSPPNLTWELSVLLFFFPQLFDLQVQGDRFSFSVGLYFYGLLPFPNIPATKTTTEGQIPAIWKYKELLLSGSRKDLALKLKEPLNIIQGGSGSGLLFLGPTWIRRQFTGKIVPFPTM